MTFRPLPLLTLATLLALALLVSLGVWQLDRAGQKRGLVAEYEAAAARQAHEDLFAPFCLIRASAYGQRAVMPETLLGEELRFYGGRPGDGAPGWRLLRLTPAPDCGCVSADPDPDTGACLRDDRFLVVEAGFLTLSGERSGPAAVAEISLPPQAGALTPQNDVERGDFFRFEPDSLAAGFGVAPEQLDADWWLAADAPGLPPGLAAMPPSRHVGYALTWFGLALTLVAVYFVYHHRQGRLGKPGRGA